MNCTYIIWRNDDLYNEYEVHGETSITENTEDLPAEDDIWILVEYNEDSRARRYTEYRGICRRSSNLSGTM